ncbi:MAG: MltA domain-containing protein [Pseudomonadota bacterium]
MVHQTMPTNNRPAPSASNKSKVMCQVLRWSGVAVIVGSLVACGSAPRQSSPPVVAPVVVPSVPVPVLPPVAVPRPAFEFNDTAELPDAQQRPKSRWVPVRWRELPGFTDDTLFEAWNAWIRGCERPLPAFALLCVEVRQLSIADEDAQRRWLVNRFQPYRVESTEGQPVGMLTSYYEPLLEASRTPTPQFQVPLYKPPANLASRRPWHTRQEIDSSPAVRSALRGREIAWLADPVDALILQIQGSGRVRITEADGSQKLVRVAFAATNEQPYKSVGRWLLDQGELRDVSWPSIKGWAAANPQRLNEMLWSNPRVVFFREETMSELDAAFGPRGALGVALTPGRSIAVDKDSIPYGAPVWLATRGPAVNLQKLVFAQDTGSAIVGAVRADYFAGWGDDAGALAGRVKQPLRLWVLWPK